MLQVLRFDKVWQTWQSVTNMKKIDKYDKVTDVKKCDRYEFERYIS